MALNCLDSPKYSCSRSRPTARAIANEIVAEIVEHVSTVATPSGTPKMAPAESVSTKAAAMGTTWRKIMRPPKRA